MNPYQRPVPTRRDPITRRNHRDCPECLEAWADCICDDPMTDPTSPWADYVNGTL